MDVASNPAMIALRTVLNDAAKARSMEVQTINVRFLRTRQWRDSCLGAARPDEVCDDAVVPGFMIDLEGGVRYHTDGTGKFRRVQKPATDAAIRVRFERDGVIVPSHVEFKAESEMLSIEAEEELRQLIDDTDFFNVESGLPGSSPDAYTYTIWIAVGRRSHVVMLSNSDPPTGPKLGPLLEWLNARLPERGRGNVVETALI